MPRAVEEQVAVRASFVQQQVQQHQQELVLNQRVSHRAAVRLSEAMPCVLEGIVIEMVDKGGVVRVDQTLSPFE